MMSITLEQELERQLVEIIVERLGVGLNADVNVTSIRVVENKLEIIIEVEFGQDAEPDAVAERYFGLTGRVRSALGERWKDYFPVINPSFSDVAHA